MPPDQNKDSKDRPGVIAPPPLIFAAVFFAGWLLRSLLPMRAFLVPAILFAIPSFAIAVWALVVMGRAKTNVDPYRPTTALVTSGPFAYTRNPIYLAMTMAFISASLWSGCLVALCLLPVALVVLEAGVIRREERYLEKKFGEDYRAYCRGVRRWI